MKKILVLLTAAVLVFAFCACGENNTPTSVPTANEPVVNEPVSEEPSPQTSDAEEQIIEEVTAETVAGTYKTRMWFLDESIVLNTNTTYELGNEKGTFTINEKTLTLTSKDNSYDKEEYIIGNNCVYEKDDHWYFDKDEEYGLFFSPDENGFTDQSFEACVINGNAGGSGYSWFLLDLNTDGTFTLKVGNREVSSLDIHKTYEGTYTSDGSNVTLAYEGQNYPMLLTEDNKIIFLVYYKD
ncbi:MAG: hypothetical protein IJW06_01995 [Clostridia bacterium]|nr:hypothetical protein [Clostridia bacterium]